MGTRKLNGWSMLSKRLICAAMLLAGSSLLCATPGFAQTPPHGHPSHGGPPGGHPGPHGAPHFAFAHRDFGHFTPDEHARWIGGRWNHGFHNGRFGWWWFAGGAWYFYNSPVYPYPGYVSDDYVDADDAGGAPGQYWYYCQNPPGYYPYIQRCGMPWQPVPAGAPPAGAYGPQQGPGYGPPPGANSGPPDDQPPPGYDNGPGPGDQPPPGYQGPGPNQGPGYQGPPGYPQGYQNQGPGNQPPPGPGPGGPPPPPNN